MIAATFLAVFFVPAFYVLFQRISEVARCRKPAPAGLDVKPAHPLDEGNALVATASYGSDHDSRSDSLQNRQNAMYLVACRVRYADRTL